MKKNSTKLLLVAVLVLGAISLWIMNTDTSKGGGQVFSDFAIENTEGIDRVIITEINGNKADLEKVEDGWRLNDEFKARQESIDLLMKTFKNVAVQSSVSLEMKRTVVANMAARSKKVEIYENGRLTKTYFVGSPTKDHYGTYMLLEKNGKRSSEPYVMHIPGFNGFLESRFFTDVNDWKFSGVFIYNPLEITTVKVDFRDNPQDSYQINHLAKQMELKDYKGALLDKANKILMENYLLAFEKLYFNRVAEINTAQSDSVMALVPDYTIAVTDNNNRTTAVDFFKKKSDSPSTNPVTGEEQIWDENYMYGSIKGQDELLVFQYYALGNVFAPAAYFLQE